MDCRNYTRLFTLVIGIAISSTALAEPVKPIPPLSYIGKQIFAAQPSDKKNPCPEGASVALPVYPDSYCVTYITSVSTNDYNEYYPTLLLISKAPEAKVRAWYAEHLKAWKYNADLQHYTKPDWKVYKMMAEPEVLIQNATDDKVALYTLRYDFTGMKTLISLRYKPQSKLEN